MRENTCRSLLLGIVFLGGIAVYPQAAKADVLLSQTYTTAAFYGAAAAVVDFNGAAAGGQLFSFATTAPNTLVAVIFNGEYSINGATETPWADITIEVDPAGPAGFAPVPPSGSDNAFCAGSGNSSHNGWVSAATVGSIRLPNAGVHRIRVLHSGAAFPAGVTTRLDDISLTVLN